MIFTYILKSDVPALACEFHDCLFCFNHVSCFYANMARVMTPLLTVLPMVNQLSNTIGSDVSRKLGLHEVFFFFFFDSQNLLACYFR